MSLDEASRIRELHAGMAEALDADRKKQEINDAKLRAVAQRVDYDQFCHMVAGAHLKPVKPIDKDGGARDFNYFVMPAMTPVVPPTMAAAATVTGSAATAAGLGLRVPKSGLDFHKAWRRQCKAQPARVAYLRLIDTQLIPTIFQSEFEPDILDGVVACLHDLLLSASADDSAVPACTERSEVAGAEQFAQRVAAALEVGGAEAEGLGEDVHLAAGWLHMLPEVNKFDLALEFAAADTPSVLRRLFGCFRAKGCAKLPRGSERVQRELKELLAPRALDATAAKYRVQLDGVL